MSDSFNVVCEKLREKFGSDINAEFICMKIEKGSYMWIANVDHEIAVQPVHYEIRVDCGKIFVELHVESEKKIKTSEIVKSLTDVLNNLCNNPPKMLMTLENKIPSAYSKIDYHWYRLSKAHSFDIDVSSVPAIFNELKELDDLVGETIRDVIESTI